MADILRDAGRDAGRDGPSIKLHWHINPLPGQVAESDEALIYIHFLPDGTSPVRKDERKIEALLGETIIVPEHLYSGVARTWDPYWNRPILAFSVAGRYLRQVYDTLWDAGYPEFQEGANFLDLMKGFAPRG